MMIHTRKSASRGQTAHGWLKSQHSFSFADYHDPKHMGFRSLRVINQDVVAPGSGFPTHSHKNMEIFSYVLDGTLKHQDSLGNGRELKPGQIQLMSAGSGVSHSEFNPSASEPLHFLQVWIKPSELGLEPSYTEWQPVSNANNSPKILIISPDDGANSATIHQDARIYRIRFKPNEFATHQLDEGRGLWLQTITGNIRLSDTELAPGDAASAEEAGLYTLRAGESAAEALLFDLR